MKLKEATKEDVQGYINYTSDINKGTKLFSIFILMISICIPTAFFGIYANITKIIILPIVFAMTVWLIYLSKSPRSFDMQYPLYMGIYSVFLSLTCLLAAYKSTSLVMRVPITYVIVIITAYVISCMASIFFILRLIKKGHFRGAGKEKNYIGLTVVAGVLGMSIAGASLKNISQNTEDLLMGIGLIIIAFAISVGTGNSGTHNFVKYYYTNKFRK